MSEWHVRSGSSETNPVALARDHEVLEYELDGHAFVFACEIVPNEWAGKGIAVMMHLAELVEAPRAGTPTGPPSDSLLKERVSVHDLAAAFEEDELPEEVDLATIVRCRHRAHWLFASAADMIQSSDS